MWTFPPAARSARLGFASSDGRLRNLGAEPNQGGGAERQKNTRVARKGRAQARHARPSEQGLNPRLYRGVLPSAHHMADEACGNLQDSYNFKQKPMVGRFASGRRKEKKEKLEEERGIDEAAQGKAEESNQVLQQKMVSISHPGRRCRLASRLA